MRGKSPHFLPETADWGKPYGLKVHVYPRKRCSREIAARRKAEGLNVTGAGQSVSQINDRSRSATNGTEQNPAYKPAAFLLIAQQHKKTTPGCLLLPTDFLDAKMRVSEF